MKNATIHLKSFGFLIVCWLAGFFINMMFPMVYNSMGKLACFLFGFCSIAAVGCIYGDWCLKMGGRNHLRTDSEEDIKKKQHFGLAVGIVPTVVNYILVIILYLSKFGVIKADFFPWFRTLSVYFMPFTYLVAPRDSILNNGGIVQFNMAAADLSIWAMLLFTVLPLFFLLVCWGMYYIGYNHIDVKEKILYRPKK